MDTQPSSDSSQSAGKLIAGWFDKLGLKINLSVMDDGAIQDGQYNMKGNTFTPNYDMFLWGWGGDPDPNFIMSIFTTAQINSWSDCAWSDPQYDKLFLEQQTTIDPNKRAAIVHQMEQIIYKQSPYIPTAYPETSRPTTTRDWQGWQHARQGGGVFFTSPVMASYLTVHPVRGRRARRLELQGAAHRRHGRDHRRDRGGRPGGRRARPWQAGRRDGLSCRAGGRRPAPAAVASSGGGGWLA